MKKLISIGAFVFLACLFSACAETVINPNLPACIQEKINDIEVLDENSRPSQVVRYSWEGRTVYYFPPYCCDVYGDLYDNDCMLLCHPDGGLTGRGDGNCTDFFDQASNREVVWEAPQ